jgi:predicted RND superfamily exporter protein
MGYDNNVYVQVGLVMLIGLAAKNAILIVEFAKAKHEEGDSLETAALTSARLRFRPILMTAFAFILGVVPLMRASGAGSGAQNVMGTSVFWGMLVATFLGVLIIPGNFTFIEGLGRRRKHKKDEPEPEFREPVSAIEDELPATEPQIEIDSQPDHNGPMRTQPTSQSGSGSDQSVVVAESQPATTANGTGEKV